MRVVTPLYRLGLVLLLLCGSVCQVLAVPLVAAAASPGELRWVKHRVLPGERMSEIATRYGVAGKAIIRWNKLNKKRPFLRAGQKLRVYTRLEVPQRQRRTYVVKRGDSWRKIAARFDVDADRLRKRWNNRASRSLRAGDRLVVWAEPEPEPPEPGEQTPAERLPTVAVERSSQSVGSPSRGRLRNGIQLPDNPALYSVRNPAHAYASSHTIEQLQKAIADFRQATGFDRELVVADMSRKRGGRFRPHRSHRSGRDVDIRLPLAAGVPKGTVPLKSNQVDWDAAWKLMKALHDTGQIRYIFLSRNRQPHLRRAAERTGLSGAELDRLIQFPKRDRISVVRHSRGHIKHFHVRFACGPAETACYE